MDDKHVDTRPPRRRWVLPLVLVLLVAAPIIEIWVLVRIGGWIGFWPTLLVICVLTGLGGWLISREGRRAWSALRDAVARGMDPGPELTDAAVVLLGGILLLLPGFITDAIALVFLLPFTRALPKLWLRRMTKNVAQPGTTRGNVTVIRGETLDDFGQDVHRPGRSGDDVVIEGEIEPPRE